MITKLSDALPVYLFAASINIALCLDTQGVWMAWKVPSLTNWRRFLNWQKRSLPSLDRATTEKKSKIGYDMITLKIQVSLRLWHYTARILNDADLCKLGENVKPLAKTSSYPGIAHNQIADGTLGVEAQGYKTMVPSQGTKVGYQTMVVQTMVFRTMVFRTMVV
jgi:hypothetical protein